MASTLDVAAARAQFPALRQEQIFMDNAGMLTQRLWLTDIAGYVAEESQEEVKYLAPLRTRESPLDRWWIV